MICSRRWAYLTRPRPTLPSFRAGSSKEVLDVMLQLAKEGMTMVVVSHEMGFARAAADRAVFMDEGRIIEEDAPDVLFTNPSHDRTKLFLSKIL